MDFREFKKLVIFAQKRGAKRVRGGDFELEFEHAGFTPPKFTEPAPADRQSRPAPPPDPSLEQIQNWIHESSDDPHEQKPN